MCGRFTLTQSAESIAQIFQLTETPRLEPRYNIAPTQPVPVIRLSAQNRDRQFTYLYWGLIPSWSKEPSIGAKLINARSETVTEKPSFRNAFKRRRCLMIADGFYEWKKQAKVKQPYYFQLANHQPFAFAGLWEYWESADGAIESCTMLTTNANDLMRPVHDRMPVILKPQDYDLWLDPKVEQSDRLQALLHPYDDNNLLAYPVSAQVNNVRNDSPECIISSQAQGLAGK